MLIYVKGGDSFLAKRAIDQLKAKYREKNADASELIEIDAEAELPNWADLQAVPLFATSRLVIIKKAGLLDAEGQKTLAGFAGSLPATTVAVVWDSKAPVAELATVLGKSGKTIDAAPLDQSGVRRFITEQAKILGLELASETTNQILEAAGNDLWFIDSELKFLAAAGVGEVSKRSQAFDEPFIYFRLIRQKAWAKIGQQLASDYRTGKPFEMILGSLAAAVRKENFSRQEKTALVDLLSDVDFGLKVGLIEQGEASALLAYHLPNPAGKRVQWEQTWEEIA